MTDYIRRSDLPGEKDYDNDYADGWNDCLQAIEAIPAADVVPVMRCKECVHYEMGVCLKIYDDGAANKDAWQERKPDDYCSYGEDRNVPANCRTDLRPTSMSGAKGAP